jgi:phosphopantetheinyl transferase
MVYYLGLSLLSNKHDNPHKAGRQKLLSAEARRILSQLEGRPLVQDDIARDAAGRPFFPNRDTDFSISHSGALAAVSLVRGKNLRTGCDVELVRPRAGAPAIAEEFFTAPERDYIESGGSFEETRFYQIWTLKECFLKLRGFSVFDMTDAPSFLISKNQPRSTRRTYDSRNTANRRFEFWYKNQLFLRETPCNSVVNIHLYELTGNTGERYMLATAIAGTETEQPEIRWFSQETLDCRSIANINTAPSVL